MPEKSDKPNISLDMHASAGKIKELLINFLVPVICLVGSGLLGFLVIYPSAQSLPLLKTELESKEALAAQLLQKNNNLTKLRDFKTVVDENSALVMRALTDEPYVPQLLTQIDRISKESGLTITRLNYSFSESAASNAAPAVAVDTEGLPVTVAVAPAGPVPSFVNVGMTAESNFSQLVAFFKNLENSSRLVDIDTFRYSTEKGEEESSLNVSLSLFSPHIKVESSAVTDDPVNLTLSDAKFVSLINKIKDLRYYDISVEDIDDTVIVNAIEVEESSESAQPSTQPDVVVTP